MGAVASPQIIDRYAVFGKIASGGMASVCFGRLLGGEGFARTVAIKRLHPHLAEDPEFRATLIDEARMAARIHHPNVVPTLDVVTAGGELMVVMEYVRGESLARLLKIERARGGRVALSIVSAIATGALHGLHAAHEATGDNGAPLGIVHRDVSPQNLLVGVDGLARVIDFGVALAAGRLQTTREGSIKGKIAYMAPEQIAGREVDRRADIYSMGVVLWEILAGERLFKGDNEAALVAKVISGPADPPSAHDPEVPPELDELVMRALAADPDDRFASAEEMAARLVRVVPPSLPNVVGKWVSEAARTTLMQRGAELAEIESQSGIAMVPPAPVSSRSMDVSRSRRAVSLVAEALTLVEEEGPTVASQSSSLALGVKGPSIPPETEPRRGMGIVALVMGGLLGLGLLAVWRSATAPPPPPSQAIAAPAPSPQAPALPVSTSNEPTPNRPTSPVEPSVQPMTAAPSTGVPSEPAAPSAGLRSPPHPPHPATPVRPGPPAAPPKAKPGCNPPYVIDSEGDRQYKPECL
jgi:eukaryotic-like serine/threonine-protein kinase